MRLFVLAYVFAIGATIGSFLNVVIYRMPLGLNPVFPGSRCPNCGHKIRAWDNIPIVSWILLGGRCRNCDVKISPRYLLVELATALVFLGLFFVEVLSGGANLPVRTPEIYTGFLSNVWFTKWSLIGIYAYHLALLCFLQVTALIRWDGQGIPARLVLYFLIAGVVAPAMWPHLHPVPWTLKGLVEPRAWSDGVATALLGLLGGLVAAAALARSAGRDWLVPQRPSLYAVLAVCGVFLGWQSAVSVAVIAAGVMLLFGACAPRFGSAGRVPLVLWVALAALLQVCLWRPLAQYQWWPGPHTDVAVMAVWLAGICGVSTVNRRLLPEPQLPPLDEPEPAMSAAEHVAQNVTDADSTVEAAAATETSEVRT